MLYPLGNVQIKIQRAVRHEGPEDNLNIARLRSEKASKSLKILILPASERQFSDFPIPEWIRQSDLADSISRATGIARTWDWHHPTRNHMRYPGKICGAKIYWQILRKLRITTWKPCLGQLTENRQLARPCTRITLREQHLKVNALRVTEHCATAQRKSLKIIENIDSPGLWTSIFRFSDPRVKHIMRPCPFNISSCRHSQELRLIPSDGKWHKVSGKNMRSRN